MRFIVLANRLKTGRFLALATMFFVMLVTSSVIADESTDARLKKWLNKYPQADANRDGVLTQEEAQAYKKGGIAKQRSKPEKKTGRSATHVDVAYGEHPRHVLDVWQASSTTPTPVLVFFHGGSFKAGDKSNILERPILDQCLQSGISVVSSNYRFSSDAPFPASMHDGARAIQFVRSKAKEWNIDPERIAVSGSSAGATLALWIALHDDLADSTSSDEIAKYSTRVTCACPHSGTAGLSANYIRENAGATKLGGALYQLFGVNSHEEFVSPKLSELIQEASPITHASVGDPPLFLTYAGSPDEAPFASDSAQRDWIHHVSLGVPLKNRYDVLGLVCDLYSQARKPDENAEIDFLKKHLL